MGKVKFQVHRRLQYQRRRKAKAAARRAAQLAEAAHRPRTSDGSRGTAVGEAVSEVNTTELPATSTLPPQKQVRLRQYHSRGVRDFLDGNT